MTYTGNSAYCYSNSLHMCLRHAGMPQVPEVGFLECLTGMPFGSLFLNLDMPMFFPSPARTDPDEGLTRALSSLGWLCEVWRGDEVDEACDMLKQALETGPVLVGPLDMGLLSYDPNRAQKRGGDHFLVALSLANGMLLLHDPQLYPYATLPLSDLLQAWNAREIGYARQNYTLRFAFREERETSRSAMLEHVLNLASNLHIESAAEGPVAYGGAAAFRQVMALLEQSPPSAFAGGLTAFALPIGARRNLDAAHLMLEAGEADLAALYRAKARRFGEAQYDAVKGRWSKLEAHFAALADLEAHLAAAFS